MAPLYWNFNRIYACMNTKLNLIKYQHFILLRWQFSEVRAPVIWQVDSYQTTRRHAQEYRDFYIHWRKNLEPQCTTILLIAHSDGK